MLLVPDFLDEKRDEIDHRLAELKPLVDEYNRLRAAAAALAGAHDGARAQSADTLEPEPVGMRVPVDSPDSPASANSTEPTDNSKLADSLAPVRPGPGRRVGRPRGSGTRGAEALRLVREQPGVTIPELADRMGIKQNYLYRVLPELVQEGKIAKQGRGWHPRAP